MIQQMKDMFGLTLNEGDEVIYTRGGQGNIDLIHGSIKSINVNEATVKRLDGGSSCTRQSQDLIKLKPYIMQNPELFV